MTLLKYFINIFQLIHIQTKYIQNKKYIKIIQNKNTQKIKLVHTK